MGAWGEGAGGRERQASVNHCAGVGLSPVRRGELVRFSRRRTIISGCQEEDRQPCRQWVGGR